MPGRSDDPLHAEIEARLALAVARTDQSLSDADRAQMRIQIARSLELRGGLRTVVLENQEEPEHGFDPAAHQGRRR